MSRVMHRGLLVLVAVFIPAAAQQPTAASLAKAVDAHYNHLRTLEARYTERYQGMGLDRTESGTLTLKRPGKMLWRYDTPAGKLFLLDGHSAITYTPGNPEAQRVPAKRLDDLRSPLRFLLGHTELTKELRDLTLTTTPAGFELSGTPVSGGTLKRITLTVVATGIIHGLRAEETDGAVTTFTFTALRENIPAPDTLFTFTPPPGVSVIDMQGIRN